MFGLGALVVGTIFLVLSVNPQPWPLPCLAPQNECIASWHQYVVENFIKYFLMGSISITLSVIALFLGRTRESSRGEGSTGVLARLDSSAYMRP